MIDVEQLWKLIEAGDHRSVASKLRELEERLTRLEEPAPLPEPDRPAGPSVICNQCGFRHPLSKGSACGRCGADILRHSRRPKP